MMKINNNYTFIRHGQTHWNKNGIMHGQYDIPLNNLGIIQAKNIAEELKNDYYDYIFTSPLKRAKDTVMQILKYHNKKKLIYDNRLMELNKGLLEGKHFNSEKLLKDENINILKKYNIESKISFFNRVSSLLLELENKYINKNILIISHSGTIKMCYFFFIILISNCIKHITYYILKIVKNIH